MRSAAMVHSIAIRAVPSSPKLYADFWEAREPLRALLPRHFLQPDAFAEQARLIASTRYDRAALCTVLREQNERFATGPGGMDGIAALADPRSLVVIGGQQAGLFGGPLYTVHKILTILALSRRMQGELGRPVVPVFWIASEDSDLAEVDHAWITDRDDRLRVLRMPAGQHGKLPVSEVRLGEAVASLIDEMAPLLPEGGFSEETLLDLRAAYTPGRTYPQAFGAWMARLFRDQGLVLVDPSDARLKRIAQGLFDREIRERSPVSAAVIEQTERLRKAGYNPQIELREGYLTLFHQDPERDAIVLRDGRFELKSSGMRYTAEELAALLQHSPEHFTPNAVLRPLFQDTLFPTLAVVLGPAEIAYFHQLTLAYERMGIPMPIVFPRASITLLEQRTERVQEKLGVGMTDLLGRGEHIIDDILKRKIPASLSARLASARDASADAWKEIVQEIDRLDPTLHKTAEIGAARSARQFDFIDRKIARAARRKNEVLRGQVDRLVAALAPRGGLQERTLTALPFLVRHGPRVLEAAAAGIDPFAPEHRIVVIDA